MDIAEYKYMDNLFLTHYKEMDQLSVCEDAGRRLEVRKVENGLILPYKIVNGEKRAGVVDNRGSFVELSGFEALSPVDAWGGSYEIEEPVSRREEKVIYFGRFWKHWGHFLMDMVSRLWYVLENKEPLGIVYDSTVEISGIYLEFLELLGIRKEQLIRIEIPTVFNQVIIPECAHKPGIFCSVKYKEIFDRAAEQVLAKADEPGKYKGECIYFTRRQLGNRIPMEIGEKEIEDLFRKNGYLVVAPEKYSLTEQIMMIRESRKAACLSGTLPHNMMFAEDGTELCIIRKTNKPNYRQVDVNAIRNLKVVNIDAHISLKAVGPAGPFIVDYNQNVKKYLEDQNMNFEPIGLKQHVRRLLKLIWYVPVYFARNKNSKREVPLYIGKEFSTTANAKKELFRFYIKRL